jgi:hypothetical protein
MSDRQFANESNIRLHQLSVPLEGQKHGNEAATDARRTRRWSADSVTVSAVEVEHRGYR